MKKLILLLTLLSLSYIPMNSGTAEKDTGKDRIVYICTGPKAKVYHYDDDCKGLNKCSGSIKAVRLSAISRYRRACRLCAE